MDYHETEKQEKCNLAIKGLKASLDELEIVNIVDIIRDIDHQCGEGMIDDVKYPKVEFKDYGKSVAKSLGLTEKQMKQIAGLHLFYGE